MKSLSKKIIGVTAAFIVLLALVAFLSFGYGASLERRAALSIDVGTYSLHVTVYIQRAGEEEPTYWDHHAGTLTTIGKNYIEGKLGDSSYANNTKFADDISVSTSTDSPAEAWTQIPTEITTGGLERASGTYASTGDGVWTVSHQFTASATHTNVQLTGLQWDATAGSNNDLLGADTFTPVTLNSGDKLTVTWTITAS